MIGERIVSPLQKANEYLALFDQSDYGKTFSARRMIIPAQMALGMYDEAMATSDEVARRMATDTLNDDYAVILRNRAIVAESKGRAREAYNLMNRHAALAKVVSDSLHVSEAHNYSALYHDQEQKMEIQKKDAALLRMNIYIVTSVIIALMIFVFAIYALWQRGIVKKKNQVLVQQISEAIEYKEMYAGVSRQTEEQLPLNEQTYADPKPGKPKKSDLLSINDLTDEELFHRLREVIKREFLYLDPDFDRQQIVEIFQLSNRRVGSAFSKGSEFSSLSDFIRDCRLEYSCNLLVTRPDLSIKEIAVKSGFSYASTYSTDFKNRYTMTPSRYRELKANM